MRLKTRKFAGYPGLLAILLVLFPLVMPVTRAHAAPGPLWAGTGKVVFRVSPPVQELSGAAWDEPNNILWTLGDSGTGAFVGRTDLRTFETRLLPVIGATNIDWEAMAMDANGVLWLMDVGDNKAKRSSVQLYRVSNPAAHPESLTADGYLDVTYPDGPMDVEAGVIEKDSLFLFEKNYTDPARILRVSLAAPLNLPQLAENWGEPPPIGPITDAALSPGGQLYLLTYTNIFKVLNWHEPHRTPVPFSAGFWGQAEALWLRGESALLIGNEAGEFIRPWI